MLLLAPFGRSAAITACPRKNFTVCKIGSPSLAMRPQFQTVEIKEKRQYSCWSSKKQKINQ